MLPSKSQKNGLIELRGLVRHAAIWTSTAHCSMDWLCYCMLAATCRLKDGSPTQGYLIGRTQNWLSPCPFVSCCTEDLKAAETLSASTSVHCMTCTCVNHAVLPGVGQSWSDWFDKDSSQRVGRFQHQMQWLGLRLHCHQANCRQRLRRQHAGCTIF